MYWQKAGRFADSARAAEGAGNWDPAAANAVNAVINLVDALCVHYRGQRSASDRHADAMGLLAGLGEVEAPVRSLLGRHLAALLSVKNLAQYEGRLVDASEARSALAHMERAFEAARRLPPVSAWGKG